MNCQSPLQRLRLDYKPKLPNALHNIENLILIEFDNPTVTAENSSISKLFPETWHQPHLKVTKSSSHTSKELKVGVVLSGGQAPGGHNVICGVYDALRKFHPKSTVVGFIGGPSGIVSNSSKLLTEELIDRYRNQGGFDMIGSGRTKIETPEQFSAAAKTAVELQLDGIVIIGGDDSNTNAALLAEYFKKEKIKTAVIGVPKTIDGDLKSADIEISFGFDTACKTYSEIIGNILTDMLSAKKYTFFIKLMGRSASHITLECALQTHPNLALIGEEIAQKQLSLSRIVDQIADLVRRRAEAGKAYGAILIPEGLIEFIPEIKIMIQEINKILSSGALSIEDVKAGLSIPSRECLNLFPQQFQQQLVLDRDPHGNVQVSQIETERLLISLVSSKLKKEGFTGSFNPQPMFCGYEGRAGLPSNFDSQYCYALGHLAALSIKEGKTGYICSLQKLAQPVEKWRPIVIPITTLLHSEMRAGKSKPVIKKALVDMNGKPFKKFELLREKWTLNDEYRNPGPIQFSGPPEVSDSITLTLSYESSSE